MHFALPQVVKRSVVIRGKDRSYFQILQENLCVSNAYRRLSGLPCEDLGKAATRAKVDLEMQVAQSAAAAFHSKQLKKRSEPLGVDCRGRRFWALKSDPDFIFTQVIWLGSLNRVRVSR